MNSINLGDKVRDKVTGYEGTLTARCEYLTGVPRFEVSCLDKDGKVVGSWFDGDRLEPVVTA